MQDTQLKVLGINGTYTKIGPVAQMLIETLDACKESAEIGADVPTHIETIHLADIMHSFMTPELGRVPLYLEEVKQKLLDADIVIFATPVFWSMPSPLLMQFFIDITSFEVDGDFPLRGKVAGVITHCDEDGGEKVVSDVMVPLRHLGFMSAPLSSFWRNRTGARFSEDGWQLRDHTHVLAPNVVDLALALKKTSLKWRATARDVL